MFPRNGFLRHQTDRLGVVPFQCRSLPQGIVGRINALRILDNDIFQPEEADPKQQCGIRILASTQVDSAPITECQILGNRIRGFDRAGILVGAPLRTAMIKQNQISQVRFGLVFQSGTVIDQVSIENNQFQKILGMAIFGKGEGANYVVSGNEIRTASTDPAVAMEFASGDGVFSHNECYRDVLSDNPDVLLKSSTLIVANNRVFGGPISIEIGASRGRYTVLGNICRGKINGLVPPWTPLNLEGVA